MVNIDDIAPLLGVTRTKRQQNDAITEKIGARNLMKCLKLAARRGRGHIAGINILINVTRS